MPKLMGESPMKAMFDGGIPHESPARRRALKDSTKHFVCIVRHGNATTAPVSALQPNIAYVCGSACRWCGLPHPVRACAANILLCSWGACGALRTLAAQRNLRAISVPLQHPGALHRRHRHVLSALAVYIHPVVWLCPPASLCGGRGGPLYLCWRNSPTVVLCPRNVTAEKAMHPPHTTSHTP